MPAATAHTAPGGAQAQLWNALASSPRPASASELGFWIGKSTATADLRLKLWHGAGLVDRIDGRPARYRLKPSTDRSPMPPVIDRAGRAKPRQPASYQRIWRVIRVLRVFDLPQLRLAATASERTVLGYVGLLQKTGYVRLQKLGNPRTGMVSRYVLVRNSGPVAPRETILRIGDATTRMFIDHNTGDTFDVSRGTPSQRRTYDNKPRVAGGEVNHDC